MSVDIKWTLRSPVIYPYQLIRGGSGILSKSLISTWERKLVKIQYHHDMGLVLRVDSVIIKSRGNLTGG